MQYLKQEEPENDNNPINWPEFKKSEKKYRFYQKKTTDFSEVIDLDKYDKKMESICEKFEITDPKTQQKLKAFKFFFPEGLYVIKDCLSIEDQLYIAKKCLNEYHKKPHRTNMYIYEPENQKPGEPIATYEISQFLVDDPEKYYFNKKIRWSNVGYQYDWNERKYPQGQTSIPDDLKEYPLKVIEMMGFKDYFPECVIINYYDKRNYMGGHLDDGELDQVSPIISFSSGLSCVFLIGGQKKEIKPHALKLDSGDVMIMSGKSRTCYHGVPRIIEGSFNKEKFLNWVKENRPSVWENHNKNLQKNEDGSFMNDDIHVINYLSEDRLNFNFRQVYIKETKMEEEKTKDSEPKQPES